MKDGKFHPHSEYKGVRKAREPFPVVVDGVKLNQKQLALMQREAGIRGRRDPDAGWEGLALSTTQLEKMYVNCKSNFAENGEARHNAILNTYTGSATSHVHGRTSCEKYSGYCYYCGLNINALEEKQLAKQEGSRKKHDEMPLPILETGLDDIFDDVRQTDPEFVKLYGDDKIDDSKLTKAVGDNIIYILKREKRLKNDEHISVGNINFREETEDESGHYQYDYSIWKNNPRKLINKGGTAYGMISNGTLIDMNLELFNTDKMP